MRIRLARATGKRATSSGERAGDAADAKAPSRLNQRAFLKLAGVALGAGLAAQFVAPPAPALADQTISGNLLIPDGSIGIGTSTPAYPLDVVGNQGTGWSQGTVRLTGSNPDVFLHLVNTSGGGRDFALDSSGNGSGLGAGKLLVTDVSAQAARLTIDMSGNVGISSVNPNAGLSLIAPGNSELLGSAASTLLRTSAGPLGSTTGNELALASIGFNSGNNSSLGIRALRIADATGWSNSAIGLGMDVDNTARAGPSLWLTGAGYVGIQSGTFQTSPFIPQAALHLNSGAIQVGSTKIADGGGCYYA